MKIGKSHVFVLILALIIIYAAFVSGSGGYCSAREFFSGRKGEEDDACIARLIKRADAGNICGKSAKISARGVYQAHMQKGSGELGRARKILF